MVTSGSESNDLALRLIRAAGKPGAQHIAVMGSAYHGHSLATLGISPYKFEVLVPAAPLPSRACREPSQTPACNRPGSRRLPLPASCPHNPMS